MRPQPIRPGKRRPERPRAPHANRPARLGAPALARAALVGAGLSVAAWGCRATDAGADAPLSVESAMPRARAGDVAPEFATALAALEQALAHQDDAEARRILDRMWLRRPTGRALELARSFERVLRGRECLRSVHLALTIEAEPAGAGVERLEVSLHGTSDLEVVLRPGPATLRITTFAIRADGLEEQRVESRACGLFGDLAVGPGRDVALGLWEGVLELPPRALAVRRAFELELCSGVLVHAGAELPAQDPAVAPAERCLTAGLALERVSVEDFTAHVARGGVDARATLVEAVAIASEDRARALDALWPLVTHIPQASVTALVPALRWLSGVTAPGGDPEAWRAWIGARHERRERAKPRPALALPARTPDS